MFLSIYHNQSGDEFIRRLGPNENSDLRRLVWDWCERELEGQAKPSFSEPGSHIPNGCGDYQAEIRRTKRETGSCWESEPFFLDWESEQ